MRPEINWPRDKWPINWMLKYTCFPVIGQELSSKSSNFQDLHPWPLKILLPVAYDKPSPYRWSHETSTVPATISCWNPHEGYYMYLMLRFKIQWVWGKNQTFKTSRVEKAGSDATNRKQFFMILLLLWRSKVAGGSYTCKQMLRSLPQQNLF